MKKNKKINGILRSSSRRLSENRIDELPLSPDNRPFTELEARESARTTLMSVRQRDGLVITINGTMSTSINLTMATKGSLTQVSAVTFDPLQESFKNFGIKQIPYKRVFYSKSLVSRIKTIHSSTVLFSLVESAVKENRSLTFLCSDHIVMGVYADWFTRNSIDFFLVKFNKHISSDQRRKLVRLVTISDFIVASADATSFIHKTNCVCILDEHLRTPAYTALSYCLNNIQRDFSVLLFTIGNSMRVAGFPLRIDMRNKLPSLDFEEYFTDTTQKNVLKHIGGLRTLFVLPDLKKCMVARTYLRAAGIEDVEIIDDNMTSQDLITLWANCNHRAYALLCTGWVERLVMFAFDCIYDSGVVREIDYNQGFCYVYRNLFASEVRYRQCLAKYYYNYNVELGLSTDHQNSLENINVHALLKYHDMIPADIPLKVYPEILTGLSLRAVSSYFATSLPLPIFVEYINVQGDVVDNYSAAISLFSVREFDFTSSGSEKSVHEYAPWVTIENADALIENYSGYNKIPFPSYIDELTIAMLILNSFKSPSIVESLQRIGKFNNSVVRASVELENIPEGQDMPVLRSSTSTPVKVSDSIVGHHSPLSPVSLSERIGSGTRVRHSIVAVPSRSTSLEAKRSGRKVSISEPIAEESPPDSAINVEIHDEEVECHSDESEVHSLYSISSKMSMRKKSRSVISKRATSFKNAAQNIKKRIDDPGVEKHRVKYHLDNMFVSNNVGHKRNLSMGKQEFMSMSFYGDYQELMSLKINEYIIPYHAQARGISLQTSPSSDDVALMCKFITKVTKMKNKNVVMGLSSRSASLILCAFCTCWNTLLSGGVISERNLSIPQRVVLSLAYNVSRVRDVVTIQNLMFIAKLPALKHLEVQIKAHI